MSIESSKARVEAAKSGPWEWVVDSGDVHLTSAGEVMEGHVLTVHICPACFEKGWPCLGGLPGDQAFIAHARQDVPALLAVAEAARDVMVHVEHEECDAPWCVSLRAALAALEALP